jgi:hypothetical protein
LSARNLHVRGYFELLSQGDRGRKATTAPERRGIAGCSAIIGGNVDLGGSQLGWLQCILTCPLENRHGNKDEWCLEQSTVKRLVFFDPLPNGINIRGAECSAIEIPREGEENVRKNLYRVCQPNTEFIAMDERLLRREGDFEKANHAYAQHQRTLNSGFVGAVRAGIFRFAANPWSPFICALALVVLWAFAWTLTYFPQNWTLDHPPGSDKLSASQPNSPTSAAPTALSNPGAPSTVSAASTPVKPPDSVLPAWQNGHFVWRAFDIAIPVVHVQSYTSGGETRLKDLGPTTIGPWHLPISPGFVASLISGFGWVWGSLLLVTLSGVAKRE